MALTDESAGIPATMLVSPNNNSGFGFGDSGWWIILLFLLLGGGFNNNNGLYPWMNQAGITTEGFQNQLLNDNITSIRDGVSNLSTQLCNGFANAEIAANGRQMADMNQAFAAQTAMSQGFNALGTQFANCCCENRLASADLKYTIATENCADRAALSDGIRDIITNQTANTQRILDQLCNDKIDAKNEKIADLERQLTMANLAASQTAQTAAIRAGQVEEIDAMYNRLKNCPVPSMPVYGTQPIFTVNTGCGA